MTSPLRRLLPALFAAGVLGVSLSDRVHAESPDRVAATIARIDELYLERSSLEVDQLFAEAAHELEEQVEWLMVDVQGPQVTLKRGDGQVLGEVTVAGWEDLQRALADLQELAAQAGADEHVDDLEVVLLSGMTDALDRHSRVLHGERLQAFDKRLKGTFYGIGLRLELTPMGKVVVAEVFPESPGGVAGVREGDVLLRVDGVSTLGMRLRDATDRLTGTRASAVTLLVGRPLEADDGSPSDELMEIAFTIERDEIRVPNVRQRVLEGKFGYIQIDHFSELTELYLDEALRELDEADALSRGLVIDLRGNTGGSMLQSARAVDAFVKAGDLVRTVGPDGGRVRGLAEHIWADDDGSEPDTPIVVLQNSRTASGAEILAGSLRELDRAILIGDRSYGKGTVQKVYTLGPGTRLKLTVARYLLAGGLSIADVGIEPDLAVGKVLLDHNGVDIFRPDVQGDGLEPLLFVDQREGWASQGTPEAREDVSLELALRVLARTEGSRRHQLLATAGEIGALVRAEEEQRLTRALAARELDWSPAAAGADRPRLSARLSTAEPAQAGQPVELVAEVRNDGPSPLHRAMLHLQSEDRTWDGRVLPIGKLLPGESATLRANAFVRHGLPTREAPVLGLLQVEGHADQQIGSWVLGYEGGERPKVRLAVKLQPVNGQHRATIDVSHDGRSPLSQVRVRFEYPESTGIELNEYDALIPALGPGERSTVHLGLDLDKANEGPLPLHVIVHSERFGQLADQAFELPRDGTEVVLGPPGLTIHDAPRSAPPGPLLLKLTAKDDVAVDHLVVWAGKDKVAWFPGEGRKLEAKVPLDVHPGRNRYLVEIIDDQGLRTRERVFIRGASDGASTTSDAGPDPD